MIIVNYLEMSFELSWTCNDNHFAHNDIQRDYLGIERRSCNYCMITSDNLCTLVF